MYYKKKEKEKKMPHVFCANAGCGAPLTQTDYFNGHTICLPCYLKTTKQKK